MSSPAIKTSEPASTAATGALTAAGESFASAARSAAKSGSAQKTADAGASARAGSHAAPLSAGCADSTGASKVVEYLVAKGDTLWDITGGSAGEIGMISALNHLDGSTIYAGETIRIDDYASFDPATQNAFRRHGQAILVADDARRGATDRAPQTGKAERPAVLTAADCKPGQTAPVRDKAKTPSAATPPKPAAAQPAIPASGNGRTAKSGSAGAAAGSAVASGAGTKSAPLPAPAAENNIFVRQQALARKTEAARQAFSDAGKAWAAATGPSVEYKLIERETKTPAYSIIGGEKFVRGAKAIVEANLDTSVGGALKGYRYESSKKKIGIEGVYSETRWEDSGYLGIETGPLVRSASKGVVATRNFAYVQSKLMKRYGVEITAVRKKGKPEKTSYYLEISSAVALPGKGGASASLLDSGKFSVTIARETPKTAAKLTIPIDKTIDAAVKGWDYARTHFEKTMVDLRIEDFHHPRQSRLPASYYGRPASPNP
ncbi:MAG: LysM peptidoglycan-binding domain-containing protein [Hyphomicrobiales bacterium]